MPVFPRMHIRESRRPAGGAIDSDRSVFIRVLRSKFALFCAIHLRSFLNNRIKQPDHKDLEDLKEPAVY